MASKLYVGNLPYSTTDESLAEAFAPHGTVESARVITSPDGRSRGFGFVEMASESESEAAIAAMHGKDMEGRTLVVNPARPKERE